MTKPPRKKPAKAGGEKVSPAVRQTTEFVSSGKFDEVLALIEAARRRAYQAVNTELVGLYWELGEYISKKIASAECATAWLTSSRRRSEAAAAEGAPGLTLEAAEPGPGPGATPERVARGTRQQHSYPAGPWAVPRKRASISPIVPRVRWGYCLCHTRT
jgi:hypothetical protein